ncbi:MAG: ornithine carbamoyltransferase [Desulfobacterales bacterium]
MAVGLQNRHFLKLLDFTAEEIAHLLDLSARLKEEKKSGRERPRLEGKNIALIFEKTSTRTRCAFEVAAYDQGARVTYLDPAGSQLGKKESIRDTARVLGRMYDGIEYRGFSQERVEELARYAGVPVWNGLTDEFHPTQALADLLTMREHAGRPLSEIAFAFLGDGRNNVANSLLVAAAKMGMDFRVVAPAALQPADALRRTVEPIAKDSGARLSVTSSVAEGVRGCDFLYTDVWVSMGEPESVWEERIRLLTPYRVDAAALAATGNPRCKFLHCLPAFHDRNTEIGEAIHRRFGLEAMEVTDEVFESPASIVFDQAENRLHTIKAVLVATLGGEP